MADKIMTGMWRYLINVPNFMWRRQIPKVERKFSSHLKFMSDEHRLVHHFVVRELPLAGKPLSPAYTAEKLAIPPERVKSILDDLERHMTFLFRNADGEVVWAYPVTVEKTPHSITFDTGEKIYAA
jgi:hypothetical protein